MKDKPVLLMGYVHHPLVDLLFTAQPVDAEAVEVIAIRFSVGAKKQSKKAEEPSHPGMGTVAESLFALLEGKVHFCPEIYFSLSWYTPFQASVVKAALTIPWGTTVSYKELAAMSGHPKAIRAVASVMRNNHFPLVVPCHRVINSDGSIGGFSGQSAGKMIMLKQRLLEREGWKKK